MKPTNEMIEAALTVYAERYAEAWENPEDRAIMREDVRDALTAAMPLIERAVAERIADKIEESAPEMGPHINITQYRDGKSDGMYRAADIARRYGKEADVPEFSVEGFIDAMGLRETEEEDDE